MRLNRFFWNGPIEEKILLDEEESNHLLNVLRLPKESRVELYNGKGLLIRGAFIDVEKKRALIRVEEVINKKSNQIRLAMAVGLCRPQVMSLIVEKLSEIGVEQIIPFISRYCSERYYPEHLKRWQRISLQVLKVTGRLFVPEVFTPVDFEELIRVSRNYPEKIFFDFSGSSSLPSKLWIPVLGVVGPPGDLTPEEKESLLANDFKAVKINDAVLKTETAVILGAGILKNA